jgi:hypothetical protein
MGCGTRRARHRKCCWPAEDSNRLLQGRTQKVVDPQRPQQMRPLPLARRCMAGCQRQGAARAGVDCVINRIVLWVAWALAAFLSAFNGHLIVLVRFRLASRAEASGGRSEFPFALPIHQHATHAQVFLETVGPFRYAATTPGVCEACSPSMLLYIRRSLRKYGTRVNPFGTSVGQWG